MRSISRSLLGNSVIITVVQNVYFHQNSVKSQNISTREQGNFVYSLIFQNFKTH